MDNQLKDLKDLYPLFLESLGIVFNYLFLVLKLVFVFSFVCATFIRDILVSIDWRQLIKDADLFRDRFSRQFTLSY